jgi:two-component system response regulator TtrR
MKASESLFKNQLELVVSTYLRSKSKPSPEKKNLEIDKSDVKRHNIKIFSKEVNEMDLPLIAVVDDEPELLENFQFLLADQFRVATFTSPATFLSELEDLEKRQLRLLITDFKMPGMTGLEMVVKAHQKSPALPFIILSGFLDKKTVLAAVEIGAFRLLEKPANPEDVLASVDQLLIESNLSGIRNEIRQITSQLRELYASIRLSLMQYIPEDLMEAQLISDAEESAAAPLTFEQLLEHLEHRLDELLKTETVMTNLKTNRWKS